MPKPSAPRPHPPVARSPSDLPDPAAYVAPKPPSKPKTPPAVEIAVVCRVCGTRMHAKESQIGSKIACPDCTTVNLVRAPTVLQPKPKTPLQDLAEFDLNDPGDRPKYRPILRPRDEDAILGDLDVIDTQSSTLEGSLPPPIGREGERAHAAATTAPATAAPRDEEDEFKLSEDFDRPATAQLPPMPSPEKLAELKKLAAAERGSYGDELWDKPIDRRNPEEWKKSPFMLGVVTFLFHTDAMFPWVTQIIGAWVVLAIGQFAFGLLLAGGYSTAVGMPFLAVFMIVGTLFTISFSAVCLAVVQDTANGMNHVANWPGLGMHGMFDAITIPVAAFVAAFPGMCLAGLMMRTGETPLVVAPLVMMMSCLIFFPLVLFSMLAEGTIFAPYSSNVVKSIQGSGDGWMLIYMLSFVIGLIAAIGISFVALNHWLAAPFAAAILVTITLIYFRLLGRLMWYSQKNLPQG